MDNQSCTKKHWGVFHW